MILLLLNLLTYVFITHVWENVMQCVQLSLLSYDRELRELSISTKVKED
jgi:hypothetical protein